MPTSSAARRGDPIATYASGKQQVRKKNGGTLLWEQPSPGMPLHAEDAIATLEHSEAVIVFHDKSELIVEPGSLVIIEEAPSMLTPGGKGRIVARLIKGSVRQKTTPNSSLFLKVSRAKDAVPVRIDATRENSVFRVVHRQNGFEIIVESGTILLNGSARTASKLEAPRLRKPKIEIKKIPEEPSGFLRLFFPEAHAADDQISIRFAWDETPGATGYVVQIARNQEFTDVLRETRVTTTEFKFIPATPEKKREIFFRVAGVSADGSVGEYSAIERVEITPEPTLVLETAPPRPTPILTAPAATPVLIPENPKSAAQYEHHLGTRDHAFAWLGARYEHRVLGMASGGGFVPTVVGMGFQRVVDQKKFFSLGATFIYEKATPTLAAPSDASFGTSALRAWVTYGWSTVTEKGQLRVWHSGPYFANSMKISQSGLAFVSSNLWFFGVAAAIQSNPEEDEKYRWRGQIAPLFVGTLGADTEGWLRTTLVREGHFKGLFVGLEISGRVTTIETSYGAALQAGLEI